MSTDGCSLHNLDALAQCLAEGPAKELIESLKDIGSQDEITERLTEQPPPGLPSSSRRRRMPRLKWLDVCGLRSFGLEQNLTFERPLALIWGGNSQGKTSIAEAIEFLLTGTVVRRLMLGGAKNEYNHSLRNAYHPVGEKVFVRAGVEDADGKAHTVERELIRDFERNQDCQSRLIIDSVEVADLSSIGIQLADPPLRAPVLFQHSIRYALSAAPSDRLTYFKALLEVSDLDFLADELKRVVDFLPLPPMPFENDLASCLADDDLAPLLDLFRDGAPASLSAGHDHSPCGSGRQHRPRARLTATNN